MSMRKVGFLVTAVVAVAALFFAIKWAGAPNGASAQAPTAPNQQGPRGVAVEVAQAVRKPTPVRVDALGTVTPIASVAIKPRVDSEIVAMHFADGAVVKQGDVLISLDSRSIEAQIAQAEGNLARDEALLAGAQRDFNRYTDLVSKGATPIINLDNSRTQVASFSAAVKADEGALKNLNVQLSYTTIRAPISGRISAAAVKVGNFVRSADFAPIATIIQTAPIYVNFPLPQHNLPALREAVAAQTASLDAIIPGDLRRAKGRVTMIENTVDTTTGMILVRATMPNEQELLWPGTLVNVEMTVREDDAVVVPSVAVQVSQSGTFVFVVKDGKAFVQAVKVARQIGRNTVIGSGLTGGETVVTDGHLQLTDGATVAIRERKTGT